MSEWEYKILVGETPEELNSRLANATSEGWQPTQMSVAGSYQDGWPQWRYVVMVGRSRPHA